MIKYLVFALGLSISMNAQSHYPGQHNGKLKLDDTKNAKVLAFNLQDVKLLDSPFKDNMLRESKWIMNISTSRLLHSFRTNAGAYSGNEGGYFAVDKLGGWESLDCELRGHSTGHILSGLALLYASTGESKYKVKSDSLVNGLVEVQKILNQKGYLSAFPQNLIDRAIAGQKVWAPWYTQHKLFSGLIDQYLYCDNKEALEISKGMADWAYEKLKPLSDEQRKKMLRNEFGGMNDSFYALYQITGNTNYKFLAEYFYHEEALDPLLSKVDNLNKKHANTYIPKLIGISRAYELEGGNKNREIPEFFWNTVVDHHSFVTGSNSDKEKFFEPDHLSEHLSGYTGESCNVYNMLKLTRHLYSYNPKVKYVDYYEKALYNHILGQQDPKTGMVAYFLPMKTGAHKVYSTPENSFWCCVGSGFENQAKYGEFIYYHDQGLYVNLFIPSELNWKEKGLTVKQQSRFPNEGTTELTLNTVKPVTMPISIRYPSWATAGVEVKINGKKQQVNAKPGTYIVLNRKWADGDKIEVAFEMPIKLVTMADNSKIAAVTYGPVVLAGKMGAEGMIDPAPYSNSKLYNDYYTYDYRIPTSISNDLDFSAKKLRDNISKTKENALEFKINETNIVLEPIYNIHRERYVIYWNLTK
ncbi:glycoside hydrolase family 127 protein [Flavobacterium seoulense]|uniref:Acetyl-CoA carboxylase n=1 Tax=Flavobacterium seoulense TaxID=1492738 RepID=A0A066WZZ1_9FLAO|nr:glycoside hydrolase family 127 protein [Flavobacterium seoulense]KDN56230.1 acetyl-CoA carboxylase [Flavobacterium seoulense]